MSAKHNLSAIAITFAPYFFENIKLKKHDGEIVQKELDRIGIVYSSLFY